MSKIICDVCGTAYPETAAQCPICGTAKPDVSGQSVGDNNEHYAYVKGGRFSHSNVRKRNASMQDTSHSSRYYEQDRQRTASSYGSEEDRPRPAPSRRPDMDRPRPAHSQAPEPQRHRPPANHSPARDQGDDSRSNKTLMIIVGVLLAAIILVCAFIAIRIINMSKGGGGHNPGGSQSTVAPGDHIPCTNITLQQMELTFTAPNDTKLLSPILEPSNTTETVYFSSTNENIVTVNEKGYVTPVADGEAAIRITCGGHTVECKIVCKIGVKPVDPNPTPPTIPEPTEPSVPAVILELNRTDFTLTGYGATWDLYDGPLDVTEIKWSSDDPSIATVTNGTVTAVGNGKTKIRAEYQGHTATCIVRCANVGAPVERNYKLTSTDVTLHVGQTFTLSLLSKKDDSKVNVTFQVKDPKICSVNEKGVVTSLSSGTTTVYVEYEGVLYECIVRVP